MQKKKRMLGLLGLFTLLVVFLSGCSTKPVTANSTGFWDHYIVWNFSRAIVWLSDLFNGSYGVGIIIFTIIIRVIILPLMQYQMNSSRKMMDIQPQMKALQTKYSSRDIDTQQKLQAEMSKLYKDAGVHPFASMLPLLVQMPVLIALYQAIQRTSVLRSGTFLWMELGHSDPYFILPILAALFTFATSKLTMMGQVQQSGFQSALMVWGMPIMILFMAISLPSALAVYWVVTNAFSVGQTLLLMNPFKLRAEREAKERKKRKLQRQLAKARRGKKRKRK
ncbi:membrane protein insertase YidC [Loigolactobacillus rennini]|uniref:Membrane protein insertase YidC n=1 Tax=Loigolactobacillus rennini TaxID=238013 RepID=A0A1K2I9V2_9LACO|nr:membrane protein insertase YidC [Loigolactobacillus rennini]SFZ89157.1 Inner membrane protein translocase component YidC, short form OxaI-like [Loigolactobacillus rennini]